MDSNGQNPWIRSRDPLYATFEGSPQTSPGPQNKAYSSRSGDHTTESEESNASVPWYRALTDDQVRQCATMSEPAHDAISVSKQPTKNSLMTDQSSPTTSMEELPTQSPGIDQHSAMARILRRTTRNSRLQQADLEHVTTPSAAAGFVKQPANTDQIAASIEPKEQSQSALNLETRPWKAKAYPLQSGTTSSTLKNVAQPLFYQDLALVSTPPMSPYEETQDVATQTAEQLQGYSMPPLMGVPKALPASPPLSATELRNEDKASAHQLQEPRHPAGQDKPMNRRKHPLQALATYTNLGSLPTPPPSTHEGSEDSEGPYASQGSSVGQDVGTQSTSIRPKTFRRQSYPMQSLDSTSGLKLFPASSSATTKQLAQQDEQPALQGREKELATKVINSWRRRVYPVQSPDDDSSFFRAPTPQPPEDMQKDDITSPGPVHLPKNIRAVTNAGKANPKGRTLVVCLDGTGDQFDHDNSNIVLLISALKKDDPQQVTYYQAGIGTYGRTGLSSGTEASLDRAVGSSLGLHVREAYHFLMHTYKEGDKICIFGFSRGAYTARCLAGMIHKVGLLPPRNIQQIPFAYEFYKDDTPKGWAQSDAFKETFSIDVCVYFLGCFDSVASVGIIPRQLPLSTTPTNKPRYFRHAMALDERRAKFKICRHETKDWENNNQKSAHQDLLHSLPNHKNQHDRPPWPPSSTGHDTSHHPTISNKEYASLSTHRAPFDTDVLEVWFAGCHADVGGGAVFNEVRHKLAQIPLRWMIRQAFECNTGIIFKTRTLAEFGLDVHTLYPTYTKLSAPVHAPPPSLLEKYTFADGLPPKYVRRSKLKPLPIDKSTHSEHAHHEGEGLYHLDSNTDEDWTPEQVEDFYDAMSPVNDQLIAAPSWWLLEFYPVQYDVPLAPGESAIGTSMNLGRYRGVEDREPNLHWTVLQKMQYQGYKIRARTAPHITWRTVV